MVLVGNIFEVNEVVEEIVEANTDEKTTSTRGKNRNWIFEKVYKS